MKIGLDINGKSISAALLKDDQIVKFVDRSIYSNKRDCNRTVMEKILLLLSDIFNSDVKGIGLSLPTKIDEKRGVIYDIEKIPYWKGVKIKKIIEDRFETPLYINSDINCYVLGEKHYGVCKGFKDIVCITLGPNIGTSIIVDDKLFLENKYGFENPTCLANANYNCVRNYKSSYMRTIEELSFLAECFDEDTLNKPGHKLWDDLGILLGRLISILLSNYDAQLIVLSGKLAKVYSNFAGAMDKYLEKYIHPQVLLNMIVVASMIENPRVMGAASLIPKKQYCGH